MNSACARRWPVVAPELGVAESALADFTNRVQIDTAAAGEFAWGVA